MADRIGRLALIGLTLGLLWGIGIAVLAFLAGGVNVEHRHGSTPLYQIVLVLVLGGTVAGALTGLLLPLAKRRVGAFLVGIVALAPYVSGLVWVRGQEWKPLIALAASLIIGGGVGLIFHRIFQEDGAQQH